MLMLTPAGSRNYVYAIIVSEDVNELALCCQCHNVQALAVDIKRYELESYDRTMYLR